jgi:geranylgeranyl diphosphate synthase, type III
MSPGSLQSPATIPPRTSSTGVVTGIFSAPDTRLSVMSTLSEGDWMSSSKRKSHFNAAARHSRNRSSIDWTKTKDGFWSQDKEGILLGPYDYMLQNPGKDIRGQLITAFNAWLKVPADSLAIITKVVAMLHTASLL